MNQSETGASRTVITVLGMHRCGTSALTRVLNLLGAELPDSLLGADQNNTTGYWEPRTVVRVNDDILEQFDRHWGDPRPIPTGWTGSRRKTLLSERARSFLENDCSHLLCTLIKDPRLSLTFPVWRDAIEATGRSNISLIAFRHPLETAQSLQARNGITLEYGLHLWLSYLLEAEYHTRGQRRAFVNYSDLLENWRGELSTIQHKTGLQLQCHQEAVGQTIDQFLDKKHKHHSVGAADTESAEVFTSANRLYQALCEHGGDTQCFRQIRNEWLEFWNNPDQGALASRLLQTLPDWHRSQSVLALTQNLDDKALFHAGQTVRLDTVSAPARYHLGNLQMRSGEPEKALIHFRKARALEPTDPRYTLAAAKASHAAGDTRSGVLLLEQYLDKGPADATVYRKLAEYQFGMGLCTEAIANVQLAIKLQPDERSHGFLLADILWEKGDLNQSVAESRQTLSKTTKPQAAEPLIKLGLRLRSLKRHKQSVQILQQALDLSSDNLTVLTNLADQLLQMSWENNALKALSQLIEKHPDRHDYAFKLARLALKKGELPLAESSVRLAIDGAPACDHYHYLLAEILHQSGRFFAARDSLSACLAINADLPKYHALQTQILTQLGQWDDARLSLQAASADAGKKSQACKNDTVAARKDAITALSWKAAQYWSQEESVADPKAGTGIGKTYSRDRHSADTPTLSVMIPVYNVQSPDWLKASIESVLKQDKGETWAEIIVVDDASGNTLAQEIASSYAPRVRYHKHPSNLGILANHNYCLSIARGDYVHILHQDDSIADGFYDALLGPLCDNPALVAAFCRSEIIGSDNAVINRQPLEQSQAGPLHHFLCRQVIAQRILFPSVIVRRDAYLRLGGFSPSLSFAFDWEMWARLAAIGPVWYEPSPLARYRSHSSSETHAIDIHTRLDDCMNAIGFMLPLVPEEIRESVAQLAYYKLAHGMWWQLDIARNATLRGPSVDRAREILMRAAESEKTNSRETLAA